MIKIKIENDFGYVFTPYNADFVKKIKSANAKWDSSSKSWKFPISAIEAVRNICRECFGYADNDENIEKVSLKILVKKELFEPKSAVVVFGKTISQAWGRDSGAKADNDVFYEKGEPQSGGSAKNWGSVVPENSVIIINNVAKTMINSISEERKDRIEILEIHESNKTTLFVTPASASLNKIPPIPEFKFSSDSVRVRLVNINEDLTYAEKDKRIAKERTFNKDELKAKQMSILVTLALARTTETNDVVEKIINEGIFEIPKGYENLYEIVYNKIGYGVVLSHQKCIDDANKIINAFK